MKLGIDDRKLADTLFAVLKKFGVVVMPCDTIYGIVGVAPQTEKKIRALKGRQEKSFLQLIPSADWLPRFSDLKLPAELARFWPGALTVIFPAKASDRASVALRVPDDPLLLSLMERLGKSLYSTSVNLSGRPPLWRSQEIISVFEGKVDLVVDAGDRPDRVPSTILDITSRPFRILRQGAVQVPEELLF